METHHHNPHGVLNQIEEFFYDLYKKVPWHLPANIREIIVKFGPWITLIILIFAIPVILMALGIGAFLAPYAMYGHMHTGGSFLLGGLIALAALILEVMALPGLFARSKKAWHLIFYACLLSSLNQLIRFDLIGLIVGLALSLYVLFEIREYYH